MKKPTNKKRKLYCMSTKQAKKFLLKTARECARKFIP